MPLNAELEAIPTPFGTEFPGTVDELLSLIAEYMAITGLNPFAGINYGDVEPSADERDRPWFKTDSSGNPIGWFAWDGSAWVAIPSVMASGTTAQRPATPLVGQTYFDTDIDVALIFNGAIWRTEAGSPGDVKEVYAADLTTALTKNPGWSHDTDTIGMVIGGASDGSGAYAYDTDAGADAVTMVTAHLPVDTIPLETGVDQYSGAFQNGPQPAGVFPIVTGLGTTMDTGLMNAGPQTDFPVRQPTKYLWRLYLA